MNFQGSNITLMLVRFIKLSVQVFVALFRLIGFDLGFCFFKRKLIFGIAISCIQILLTQKKSLHSRLINL